MRFAPRSLLALAVVTLVAHPRVAPAQSPARSGPTRTVSRDAPYHPTRLLVKLEELASASLRARIRLSPDRIETGFASLDAPNRQVGVRTIRASVTPFPNAQPASRIGQHRSHAIGVDAAHRSASRIILGHGGGDR